MVHALDAGDLALLAYRFRRGAHRAKCQTFLLLAARFDRKSKLERPAFAVEDPDSDRGRRPGDGQVARRVLLAPELRRGFRCQPRREPPGRPVI